MHCSHRNIDCELFGIAVLGPYIHSFEVAPANRTILHPVAYHPTFQCASEDALIREWTCAVLDRRSWTFRLHGPAFQELYAQLEEDPLPANCGPVVI